MRSTITALVALSLLGAATVAGANETVVEIRVPTAGLNLADARAVQTLQARVDREARAACEVRDPLGRAASRTDWSCVREARAEASRQLAVAPVAPRVAAGN